MKDSDCVHFLQWALPHLRMRWPGFRKVRKQVCKRIDRRLRELGLEDVAAYRNYLETHQEEWSQLDRFCPISISRFYRDRGVFDYLRDETLPRLARLVRADGSGTLRCWSAGSASGEEPYTLNILWKLQLARHYPGVTFRVVATDSEAMMLDRARQGRYSMSSFKDAPENWLTAAFTESDDSVVVKPEFREGVDFLRQDIRREIPPGQFHLILCRHLVFTYFDVSLQEEILRRILEKVVTDGVLVTGKHESLPSHMPQLKECPPRTGIYRKKRS